MAHKHITSLALRAPVVRTYLHYQGQQVPSTGPVDPDASNINPGCQVLASIQRSIMTPHSTLDLVHGPAGAFCPTVAPKNNQYGDGIQLRDPDRSRCNSRKLPYWPRIHLPLGRDRK